MYLNETSAATSCVSRRPCKAPPCSVQHSSTVLLWPCESCDFVRCGGGEVIRSMTATQLGRGGVNPWQLSQVEVRLVFTSGGHNLD
jgi:hypothetical protein